MLENLALKPLNGKAKNTTPNLRVNRLQCSCDNLC
jgi:hypothetical protein